MMMTTRAHVVENSAALLGFGEASLRQRLGRGEYGVTATPIPFDQTHPVQATSGSRWSKIVVTPAAIWAETNED
jgi:hypothetical protein